MKTSRRRGIRSLLVQQVKSKVGWSVNQNTMPWCWYYLEGWCNCQPFSQSYSQASVLSMRYRFVSPSKLPSHHRRCHTPQHPCNGTLVIRPKTIMKSFEWMGTRGYADTSFLWDFLLYFLSRFPPRFCIYVHSHDMNAHYICYFKYKKLYRKLCPNSI